ncbi:MAG: S41 family peptidase [Candidatus Poribacteria bacterium]|nr:S41 family peptidase [Candidatus Poribacteria bacterium]
MDGAAEESLNDENTVIQQLSLFSEVLARVQQNHYDDPNVPQLVEGAIRGLLRVLDPYSQYYTPAEYQDLQSDTQGKFGGLGMYIGIKQNRLTVITPIEDTPADEAGVLAGDHIIDIDGKATTDMTTTDAANLMRGEPGTDVTITILREGVDEPIVLTITRDIITEMSVKYANVYGDLGYIRLTQFKASSPEAVSDAIVDLSAQGAKGLILDLRSNPGGLLSAAVEISSQFLQEGELVVYTQGGAEREDYSAIQSSTRTGLPLVVLVNNGSASASEIVAGALKAHRRAILLGGTTFGKASVQKIYPLREGGEAGAVKLTTYHYYTPDGVDIHTLGIEPHVALSPFSPLESRMWRKVRTSDALKTFVEGEGDDLLAQVDGLKRDETSSPLRRKYRAFIDALAEDNAVLGDPLIKYAIALETTPETDDYEYDPQILAASQYLRAFDAFRDLRQPSEGSIQQGN